jgi:NTE family protein
VRIGLVLGAGGSVGLAYHGAALAALADVTGWDPRDAAILVGTSAGSISAAMLRAGLPAGDLMRITEGLPLSDQGARLAANGRPRRPRPKPDDVLHIRPVADLLGVVHGLAHVRSHPLGPLLAALLPSGGIPTHAISNGIDAIHPAGWPPAPLWLCAVQLRDGKRVVFGQPGEPGARVGQAVAASSAVPGYFRPVAIDGRRYIDGGMRSLTNADLLRAMDLDLVIVSSPMSQASGRPTLSPLGALRQAGRWQLGYEMALLRRAGLPVVAIEPGRRVTQVMGLNPLDAKPRGSVSRVTYASVARWLSDHRDGRWLAAMLAAAALTGSVVPYQPEPGGAARASEPA